MSFLYDLIILPLVFIYELIFSICCNYLVGHFGFIKDYLLVGIIIVSLFVNILSLPLYNAADKLQKNERAKQKSMQKVVNHINHVFNGDEKFLILNSYYRLENYNPIYQLKTAIPLLLQIPFFTAAYIFFINTKIFTGESLHCLPLLKDLSKPDMLLNLFGYNINVLPIVMIAINLISSFIYTKDLNFKDKLQPLLLALIFLVLLYNSPSALVIYWILNNIFSLIKIFVISVLEKIKKVDTAECMDAVNTKDSNRLAIVSLLTIFILLAVFIPSNIIASSPTEFTISTPVNILKFTVTVFAGYFFWELLYYQMLSDRIKVIGASFIFAVSIYLLLNHIVFLNNVGILTENLIYTEGFTRFSISDVKKDICIVFFALVLFIVSTKFTKISSIISTLLLLSIFAVCIMNFYKIGNLTLSIANNTVTTQRNNEGITFSKNGRNVIVIMLDRSCGAYFSFVLSNKPKLLNVYDGFTFYKNTLSCSGGTLLGATPIFGGYDYLPQNSNKRKNTLLVDKHNEALTIMPYNFSNNGYNCTVANLPNENYGMVGKEHLFTNMNNVTEIDLTDGTSKYFEGGVSEESNIYNINRSFVFYSIMKTMPIVVKGLIYNDGFYLMNNVTARLTHTLKYYYAFDNLISKLHCLDDNSNNFLMFDNELTHNHNKNTLPYDTFTLDIIEDVNKTLEYPVTRNLDGEDFVGDYSHLSTEIAAYLQIGKLIEHLKTNNVYDNTRIIITSDHGAVYNRSFDNNYYFEYESGQHIAVDGYNPVMLYKDFGAHGSLKISNEFMTNADTPLLSMNNLINDPINPYLNKKITNRDRNVTEIDMYYADKGGNAIDYINDYTLKDGYFSCRTINIFDKNSWFTREANDNE